MTAPAYRLYIAEPRSLDPNEVTPLAPISGAPHSDPFKVTTLPGGIAAPAALTSGMVSQSGMGSFSAANCVNGTLSDVAWETDAAVPGAWVRVDLGAGGDRRFRFARLRVQDGDVGTYAGLYDVEYSDDAAVWSPAFAGLAPKTPGNWFACGWLDKGAHRYWRFKLTNTPGAGPEISELEFWEFGGPGAWKPYLMFPGVGRRGVIDPRDKRGDTGVMVFELVDPALASTDPLIRWLPAFLGNAKGKLRAGGLLVRAQESLDGGATWSGFFVGRLYALEQATPVRWKMTVRERTDDLLALAFVGRPHASITYAGRPTLLPTGAATVVYGTWPAALPGPTPLRGTVDTHTGFTDKIVRLDSWSINRDDNIVTANLAGAMFPHHDGPIHYALNGRSQARLWLKRLDTQATGYFKVALFRVITRGNHQHVSFPVIAELDPNDPGYLAMPPVGTSVECYFGSGDAEPSQDVPFLIADVHPVTLWKHLLEGKFGFLWQPPETLPPGVAYGDPRMPIAYDTAAFTALEADTRFPLVRFVVRERVPRGDWIVENLLRAANLSYYFDGDGVLVPVDLRTPTDVSAVPTVADADLFQAPPPWEYNRQSAITRIDGSYYTDVITAKLADLVADPARHPNMAGGALVEFRHQITEIDLGSADLGDAPFRLDVPGFRSVDGELYQGQSRALYLESRLLELMADTARPFGVGAPELTLIGRRGTNADAQPGELLKLAVRSIPDPATNKLGGTRLARVLSRQERQQRIELRVMDLGLPTFADAPALAAPAQEVGNTSHGVTVVVTLNALGDPVEVHFAITDTSVGSAPGTSDALWTPILNGLVRATGTVTFRGVPAGKRVWVRGRSFPDARVNYLLPSPWVAAAAPGRVDSASLAAPSSPAASLQTSRSFRVSWTNGTADLMTELLMATPTTDPRIVVARLLEGSTMYDFPGDTGLALLPSTTYRVGVRHTDGAGSYSAEVTVDVATTAVEPSIHPRFPRPEEFY